MNETVPIAVKQDSITGCLLGTAVGDALGLPVEGLSRIRQRKLFPNTDRYHFFFNRGMTSDDTEHTCMVAQALIASNGDVNQFSKSFARQLKGWLLSLPAGVGLATLKASLRLLSGQSPDNSGVHSAGNGPAMRSAIIGVCFGYDPKKLRELVRASTKITHTDPKAEYGALAVALAAYMASIYRNNPVPPQEYHKSLQNLLGEKAMQFVDLVDAAVVSALNDEPAETFARELHLENGISGYVYHTVPVVLQTWFRHGNDFRGALKEIIRCGGDTDTTAAILGGIIGAAVGKKGIPKQLVSGLMEWPRSVEWMERLGIRLAKLSVEGIHQQPLPIFFPALLLRNLFFLTPVILHGIRRLLPPY